MESYSDDNGYSSYDSGYSSFGFGVASTNRDRISSSRDPVLVKIMSFLPTINTVRTSILFRIWSCVWKLFHSFEFDLDDMQLWYFSYPPIERVEELEKLKNNQVIDFANKVVGLLQGVNVHQVSLLCTKCL